jgi:hypothetical protein
MLVTGETVLLGATVLEGMDLAFPNLNISEHQCGFPLATS